MPTLSRPAVEGTSHVLHALPFSAWSILPAALGMIQPGPPLPAPSTKGSNISKIFPRGGAQQEQGELSDTRAATGKEQHIPAKPRVMQLRSKGREGGGSGKHPAFHWGLNLQPPRLWGSENMRGISERREIGQKGSDLQLQQHWAQGDALDPAEPGCGHDKPFQEHGLIGIFALFLLAFAEVLMKCFEAQQQ